MPPEVAGGTAPAVAESQAVQTEPVLSPDEPKPEPQKARAPVQPRQYKEAAYQIRQERSRWREELQKFQASALTDDDVEAAIQVARKEGFDLSEEKDAKQIRLIAKIADEIGRRKMIRTGAAEQGAKHRASNENLGRTLIRMRYEPNGSAYRAAGSALFAHYGIENPDVFLDENKMQDTLDQIKRSLDPKPVDGGVQGEIIRRAGAPVAATQSRGVGRATVSGTELSRFATEYGVSEKAAQEIMEKRKALPKFAR